MTLRKRLPAMLCIAAALALGPLALSDASAQDMKDITIAVPNPSAITWMPLWVAIGQGFMKDEGLNVTVEAVDGSSQVLQAMAAGNAEIGAPGPGPVLAARARDTDVVFIYNLYPKSVFGVMVRAESAHKVPTDLKGTTIGVGTADGAEVAFTRAILSDANMAEGTDFEFLPVGDGGLAAAAFLRGDVESYAAAVSDAAIMTSRGLALREITPEQYLAYFGNGIAALRPYMEANPDVIEGFGRAMVKGMRFALDPANKDAVLDSCAAGNPQEGEDRDFAASLLAAVIERMTPTDRYRDKGFGYQPPEHWELWHESQVSSGALSAPLGDLSAAYSNKFVDAWNAGGQ